jgi:hypothetical protein
VVAFAWQRKEGLPWGPIAFLLLVFLGVAGYVFFDSGVGDENVPMYDLE